MSAPSNKPRDIKNLKARLGRTITPGTPGSQSVPPGMVPPSVGGGFPQPPKASVPPPAVGGSSPGGLPAPGSFPGGIQAPGSFPSGIQAPPFARPAPQPAQRQVSTPAGVGQAAAARIDPFGGGAAPQAQARKVTLVIDDSAVKDDEIGRKSRSKSLVLVVIGVGVGLVAGFGIGNTMDKNHQYSMAVADGKAIYTKVQEVSKNVDAAKATLKRAVEASSGGPGRKATVDYSAIEELVAMQRPFSANEFHRRLYRAFGDGVVDDLFDYYNNVNMMWDGFSALGAKTAGAQKREILNKSAAATDGLLNTEYGMVFTKNGTMLGGALVFVTIPQAQPQDDKKADKDEAPKVKVASVQGGQEVERTLYMGQEGMAEDYEKYVVMLDKIRSRTILGESANMFGKYRADLMELNARMEKTAETQGRLMKSLGQVAALDN
jgi:hypothetical protein